MQLGRCCAQTALMSSRILSINTAKRASAFCTILELAKLEKINIVCIQEPYQGFCVTNNRLKYIPDPDHWQFYFQSPKSKAIIAVSRNIDSSTIIHDVSKFKDVAIITIGDLTIVNIYQSPSSSEILEDLPNLLAPYLRTRQLIVIGDMNARHSDWDTDGNKRGSVLAPMIPQLGLRLLTDPFVPTFDGHQGRSTIDLTLINTLAEQLHVSCRVCEGQDVGSDHLPILVDMIPLQTSQPYKVLRTCRAWKKVNWDDFRSSLQSNLVEGDLPEAIRATAELDNFADQFTAIIRDTIAVNVPIVKITTRSKPWWTSELEAHRDAMRRARRQHRGFPRDHPSFLKFTRLRKKFHRAYRAAAREYGIEFAQDLDESKLWKHIRTTKEIITPRSLPTIRYGDVVATTTEEKRDLLATKFFPEDQQKDGHASEWIPKPSSSHRATLPPVRYEEIDAAVSSLEPHGAPGTDGITMHVIQQCWPQLSKYVYALVRASFDLGHHPRIFKIGKAIALKKPGKMVGTMANDYRPITMLNSLAKIVEKVATSRLAFWLETSDALPTEQYGFRHNRNCDQAIISLTDRVRSGWSQGLTTSTVFLDVRGAYDTVRHSTLLDELEARGVPQQFMRWIQSFLSDRIVRFGIDGCETREIMTNVGVPQGSTVSPVLYIVYNAPAFDIAKKSGCWPVGYADDLTISTTGNSIRENLIILKTAINNLKIQWCLPYSQKLADEKSNVMHFVKRRVTTEDNEPHDLELGEGTSVKAVTSIRNLGVILDDSLDFKQHIRQRVTKVHQLVGALTKLGHSEWGIPRDLRLRAIRTMILPIIAFAAPAWSPYISQAVLAALNSLYRRALIWATGMRYTTPTTTVLAESGFMPLESHLAWSTSCSVSKWQSSPHMRHITQPKQSTEGEVIKRAAHPTHTINSCIDSNTRIFSSTFPLAAFPAVISPWDMVLPANCIIHISDNKDTSIEDCQSVLESNGAIFVYTDGSKTDDACGAGWFVDEAGKELEDGLKLPSFCTIFQAEAIALYRAIDLMTKRAALAERPSDVVIFTDSLSALLAIRSAGKDIELETKLMRYAIREFCGKTDARLTLQWVAGHRDVDGNERADSVANKAREGLFGLNMCHPASSAMIKRDLREQALAKWVKSFEIIQSKSYVENELPSAGHLHSIYDKWPLGSTSRLAQFRSGHCELNGAFHFDKTRSNKCACNNNIRESIDHFFASCPLYDDLRETLMEDLRRTTGTAYASLRTLLSDPKIIPATQQFMNMALARRTAHNSIRSR